MADLSKKDAVGILQSRSFITEAGKYKVKVSSCMPFHRASENGKDVVAIANFGAMTPYQKEQAIAKLQEGDNNGAVNQNLSLSIREGDYRPEAKEQVEITVEWIDTKNGHRALLVTGMNRIKAETAGKTDFSAFLDEEDAPAEASADATALED